MARNFRIVLFDTVPGEVCVGAEMLDEEDRTWRRCSTYVASDQELAETVALAVDALWCYWRHGSMYAEPLGDRGWR